MLSYCWVKKYSTIGIFIDNFCTFLFLNIFFALISYLLSAYVSKHFNLIKLKPRDPQLIAKLIIRNRLIENIFKFTSNLHELEVDVSEHILELNGQTFFILFEAFRVKSVSIMRTTVLATHANISETVCKQMWRFCRSKISNVGKNSPVDSWFLRIGPGELAVYWWIVNSEQQIWGHFMNILRYFHYKNIQSRWFYEEKHIVSKSHKSAYKEGLFSSLIIESDLAHQKPLGKYELMQYWWRNKKNHTIVLRRNR